MSGLKITTNNVPRPILDGWDLSAEERKEFDYLDWHRVEEGSDSASFFRYRGQLYDLSDFTRVDKNSPNLSAFWEKWDGYQSDSHFSGILVKYTDDSETVIVGTYHS